MKIAIIGSGNMGSALGTLWSKKHQVMFCYSRNEKKLDDLAGLNENTSRGSVEEAIDFADIVMLAVPYPALKSILKLKDKLENKSIITCVSGLQPDFTGNTIGLACKHRISVAEQVSEAIPSAKVIEAFNITFAEVLLMPSREIEGRKPAVFYCGDDNQVKKTVAMLIEDCGYIAINSGNLRTARALETLATSWVQFAVVAGLFPRIAIHPLKY